MKFRVACAVVNPNVGRKTTINKRYQKVFIIMAWFSADLVQWPGFGKTIRHKIIKIIPFIKVAKYLPRNRSLQATSRGIRAVKDHNISVGRKSTIQDGKWSSSPKKVTK